MKQHIILLYIFLSAVLAVSCAEREGIGVNDGSDGIVSLTVSGDSDYRPQNVNEVLDGDYEKYLEFFEGTDYEIGIASGKDGALPGGSKISCISGESQIRKTAGTKSAAKDLPPIKSFVNGVEISQDNIKGATKSSSGIVDCFGKVVKFTFGTPADNMTKSIEGTPAEAEMYVPEAIEFLFPRAESEDDLNPLCYCRDFVIRWNEDESNENGVLVVVDWNGSMVLGDDIPETHVCRVATFPDTGEARLPETLFDGIPDTAHCDLMIMRGNVDNIERDQYTYKLVGQTHHLISFILVREIE